MAGDLTPIILQFYVVLISIFSLLKNISIVPILDIFLFPPIQLLWKHVVLSPDFYNIWLNFLTILRISTLHIFIIFSRIVIYLHLFIRNFIWNGTQIYMFIWTYFECINFQLKKDCLKKQPILLQIGASLFISQK